MLFELGLQLQVALSEIAMLWTAVEPQLRPMLDLLTTVGLLGKLTFPISKPRSHKTQFPASAYNQCHLHADKSLLTRILSSLPCILLLVILKMVSKLSANSAAKRKGTHGVNSRRAETGANLKTNIRPDRADKRLRMSLTSHAECVSGVFWPCLGFRKCLPEG